MSGIYFGRKTTLLASFDAVMILLALLLSFALRFQVMGPQLLSKIFASWTGASVVVITIHLLAFYVFELYNLQLDFRRVANLLRCVGAVATAAVMVAVVSFVVPRWGLGRGMFFLHAGSLAVLTTTTRAVVSRLAQRRRPTEKALLITAGPVDDEVLDELSSNPESRFQVVGTVPVGQAAMPHPGSVLRAGTPPPVGSVRDCERVLRLESARHLLVAGINTLPGEAARELLRLKTSGVEVHEVSQVFQVLANRLPLRTVDDAYFLRVAAFTRDIHPVLSNFLRVLDVCVALALLLLSSPLWLLAAAGIKLTMPGPVFFRQERVGKDEHTYVVIKFRTMGMDAEKDGAKWATRDNPRVTPFGRFLRRTRIDELPQLWTVLRGDMSLVGPRPERQVFVDQLKHELPYYALRFEIKPGLTGWAQVNYGYGATVEDARMKLSYDLYYIQERSVPLFALTLLKTIQTVLFKPGS